jgi:FG-GAP repeat
MLELAGPVQAVDGSSALVAPTLRAAGVRRAAAAAAAALLACSALAVIVDRAGSSGATSPSAVPRALGHERGLSSLPAAAQEQASAAIGADSAAYRVRRAPGGFVAYNRAQRLSARFTAQGATLRSGEARVRLSLRAVGYGDSLEAVRAIAPRVRANRVLYQHAGVSEWYVNGPLGIEQGFTIARAPARSAAGPLVLALVVSGNARPSLAAGAASVSFAGALRYGGLFATDATGRALRSRIELAGGRLLLAIDARRARYPLRVDPLLQQGSKFAGSGDSASFGASVALSCDGDTALVGGGGDDGGTGAAWVFTRSGQSWTQQGPKLTGGGESGAGEFGSSVALSCDGRTALIGGMGDDGHRGAAWVFARSGEAWAQQGAKLAGAGEAGEGWFGDSVALDAAGDTALVGAYHDDVFQGAVWVFTRSGETWTQQGSKLVGSGGCGTPYLGSSVALSADGNTALLGASLDCDVGAAWVFTRAGERWTQQGAKITARGEVGKGWFGESVALSCDGDTALIGAYYDDATVGAAWVFTRTGAVWAQQGSKLTGTGESGDGQFGKSVALSCDGASALIGAPADAGYLGAAWAFARAGETWTQQGAKLTGGGQGTEDLYELGGGGFGKSVALSSDGASALIGGGHDSTALGAVWAFAQQANGPSLAAQFGRCVAVRRVKGEYSGAFANAGCTKRGRRGGYEWYAGVDRTRFSSSSQGRGAVLRTVGGASIACRAQSGTGEYSGSTLASVALTLTFSGCELRGQACQSEHAAPGEIVTAPLQGVLGATGVRHGKSTIGLELSPQSAPGPLAAFSCAGTAISVRGSLIGTLPSDRMHVVSTVLFTAAKGRQRPESLLGAAADVLEASIGGRPYEQAGLTLTAGESAEEAIEVRSGIAVPAAARRRRSSRAGGHRGAAGTRYREPLEIRTGE